MAFADALLVPGLCICILIPSLLFARTVYYALVWTDIPLGFKQRVVLQLAEMVHEGLLALISFLDLF